MARRRSLTIRTQFEPTWLAQDQLRLAYEQVAPIRRVQIRSGAVESSPKANARERGEKSR